ncbi:hypothetical protein [Nocardioides okcheonensis]|uniref:hypothetical protein n=1 Tax=Nocardioides okcheonensis TaxID=2894081 RepID=UPI001E28A8D4|nr:hypothetical protein [Nocardioides okcheonensis]UFN42875.1 hypothetical protein LN652_12470 [Nocardioides okcheonensis]
MRTLTKRLAPHARTAWLVLLGTVAVAVAVAVATVLATGGGRVGVVMTLFTGLVAFGVLAAVLDAILVPGNPDVRRRPGAGMTTAAWVGIGSGGAVGSGGGDCGGGGGDCG